jgi:peptidoglycan/LPS O-acetylase OafA/YrhL
MAAIAWGVLAALLARRWRPSRRDARAMAVFGAFCILLVLGWGDLVHRHLYKSGMYGLCAGTCLLLLAFHAHPPAPRRALAWLARMGELSYELYLSHMFVVLGAVAAYRALLDARQDWTFAVYLPALLVCCGLAAWLARLSTQGVRTT